MQQKQSECKPSRHTQLLNQSASSRSRHNKNHVLPKCGTMLKSIPCYMCLSVHRGASVHGRGCGWQGGIHGGWGRVWQGGVCMTGVVWRGGCPLRQVPRNTVKERAVRILLECILVEIICSSINVVASNKT